MISLNTITSFKGTGSVLLDANGTGLQSVGIKQHLKSFFNFGTARAENLGAKSLLLHVGFLWWW